MNVLQINISDTLGGGSVAAYRLHQALLAAGVESRMLVDVKQTADERVGTIPGTGVWHRRWVSDITRRLGLNYVALNSRRLRDLPLFREAQVINLHSMHGGFFNYRAVPDLTADRPGVWTLHDMYAFTGHCAYSSECRRYTSGCGRCPHPDTPPYIGRDSTRVEWWLKNRAYARSNLSIVTPSRWMEARARESMLARYFPIRTIPNGLDTDAYRPMDKQWCRQVLDLPPGRRVLMFAATHLADERKGADLLVAALAGMPESLRRECVLLTFGPGGETLGEKLGIAARGLGFVGDDRFKAIAFSAADLFLLPSRSDNLPVVIQEAMACGVPTAAFDVGGVPDLVRDGQTGLLARPEDPAAFRDAVIRMLDDDSGRERMGRTAREVAVAEYDSAVVARQYLAVYESLLAGNKADAAGRAGSAGRAEATAAAPGNGVSLPVIGGGRNPLERGQA